jgi:hypothetical protein
MIATTKQGTFKDSAWYAVYYIELIPFFLLTLFIFMVLYIFTTFPDLDNCKMELFLSFVPERLL